MSSLYFVEPSVSELEAIEAEWPVIAAELAVVEAECRYVAAPSGFSLRLVRRAERRLALVVRRYAKSSVSVCPSIAAVAA